jgi:hypothetical protein
MVTMKWMAVVLSAVCALASSAARAELLVWLEGDKANTPNEAVALDSSGNGNHGLFLGTAGLTADGRTGGALEFAQDGSSVVLNTTALGALDSIVDNQSFTIAFWLAGDESAVAPSNNSIFWAESPDNNGTARGIQAHVPWSNENVYFDIAGCCDAVTQRVNGLVDRDFWDSTVGEEWTHYAFTLEGDFGDAAVYIDGQEELLRLGPTTEIAQMVQFWIGSAPNGGNPFGGRLDDFIIADNGLAPDEVQTLYEEGVEAVFGERPEPDFYTPMGAEMNLVDLDADPGSFQLGGHAFAPDGVESWRVEQVFRSTAAGQEVVAYADLSQAGVAGDGNIGDASTDVALGAVTLENTGADDMTVEFRLASVSNADPILGTSEAFYSQTFTLEGSGGVLDPFVLMGDLNQDGEIGFADFVIFSNNYGATQTAGAAPLTPEPSSLTLLLLAGAWVFAVRRRPA